jgi:predicted ArsR family transcriptional regulator
MQETRRHILESLKQRGQATVDDLVADLRVRRGDQITAVTVRHHLTKLEDDGFIAQAVRPRTTPGRPRHHYVLTEAGQATFPNNYQRLAAALMGQMEQHLPASHVNVIFEGIASQWATEALIPNGSMEERLEAVVSYLSQNGYQAGWETAANGHVLLMENCPYHHMAHDRDSLCHMDMHLIANLLGVVPRMMGRLAAGDSRCAYFIPARPAS